MQIFVKKIKKIHTHTHTHTHTYIYIYIYIYTYLPAAVIVVDAVMAPIPAAIPGAANPPVNANRAPAADIWLVRYRCIYLLAKDKARKNVRIFAQKRN